MAGEAEGLVMFEDVTVYFSREEWGLLNVTQKGLYRDVMLENFALVSSLGLAPSRSPVFTQLEDDEQSWVPSWVDVTPVSRAEARRGFGLVCHLYHDFQAPHVPASLACVSSLPFSVSVQSCLLLATQCVS